MKSSFVATAVWVLFVGGTGALLRTATGSLHPVAPKRAVPGSVARDEAPRSYPAESLAAVTVRRDLFRGQRSPATAPYDPQSAVRSATAIAVQPKPTMNLKGLVWGAAPEAVIEGLPGTDGARVVRAGEAIGGLRVVRIEPSRVVITGMDTVWTLTLRRP